MNAEATTSLPKPQAQERMARLAGLAFCLGLPLALRLLVSWMFYGSTDIQNFLGAMGDLTQGREKLFNYYPPSVFPEALGVLGGLMIQLPMTAVFKMSHALPDLFLAGWFFARLVHANHGRPTARIYLLTFLLQLAPSIVIVSHVHGQMDSWSILFIVLAAECFLQTKPAWALVAGMAMIFSVGIKVFPLFLIPCFYLARPWRLRHLILFTVGLGAGYLLSFSQYLWAPDRVWDITTKALSYQSEPLMGIKTLIWPYLEKLRGGPPNLTTFVVDGLILAYAFSWVRRLDLYRSLLLTLLMVMTVSFHLAPQYLLWPTFLLFFVGMYRTAVFYNLVSGALLISYYYFTRDNTGTYTPLISWAALAPFKPHWFNEYAAFVFFNELLRGAGIWGVIALSLVSVIVISLRSSGKVAEPVPPAADSFRIFPVPAWLWGGTTLLATGYFVTMLFTGPSDLRRRLVGHLDPIFYQKNYFSYGQNHLYEITVQLSGSEAAQESRPEFTFPGNDFYALFQNGTPFEGPYFGRAYRSNHSGLVGAPPMVHRIAIPPVQDLPADGRLKFWILDGNGSTNDYLPPSFLLQASADGATPALPVTMAGTRLAQQQLDHLFSLWSKAGRFPPDLAAQLGLALEEAVPGQEKHDWALRPEASLGSTQFFRFSIIEGLFLFLGLWAVLGLFPFLGNSRGMRLGWPTRLSKPATAGPAPERYHR